MRGRYDLDRRAEPSGSGLDHLPVQAEPAAAAALGVRAAAARRSALKASAPKSVLYSAFVKDLAAKRVKQVRFEEGTSRILYELADGVGDDVTQRANESPAKIAKNSSSRSLTTNNVILQTKRIPDEKLMSRMEAAGVDFGSVAAPPSSYLSKGALTAMALWIPLVPLYFIMRNVANNQGGGDAAKKAKSRGVVDPETRVTFEDVAGVEEAKAESCVQRNRRTCPTKQPPYGLAQYLALNIPKRHVDSCNSMPTIARLSPRRKLPIELLPDAFILHWVFADNRRPSQIIYSRCDHILIHDCSDAVASMTLIGLHFD